MTVLIALALAWWLAAPDRFTAAARTASGSAVKAAGTGAASHWRAGKPGRAMGRTDRRDRWQAKGGWWRKLLGLEHGAVVAGKAVKGTGKLAGAAVRPVPGAIRDGWRKGQDRHGQRAQGKRAGLALDLPWWRRTTLQDTLQDTPGQDSGTPAEDTPEAPPEAAPEQAGGQEAVPVAAPVLDTSRGHDLPPQFKVGDSLVDGAGKPWTVTGVRPQIDADTYDLTDAAGAPGYADIPRPDRWEAITSQDEPIDPAPINGGTMPTATANVPSVELNDLDSLKRFAEYVASLSEDSEFMQIVERCKTLREQMRAGGFGGDLDTQGSAFEETASTLATIAGEFFDEAQSVAQLAANVAGG